MGNQEIGQSCTRRSLTGYRIPNTKYESRATIYEKQSTTADPRITPYENRAAKYDLLATIILLWHFEKSTTTDEA